MKFYEIVNQVGALLQREGRVSYRALKREFDLDDEVLEDLKAELIEVKELAVDKDGRMLVWAGKDTEGEKAKRGKGEREVVSSQLSVVSPQHLAPNTQHPEAERRQLTVMFIDLVGSTALSAQLDPEDYHTRVVAYQTACHQIIARYDGHIAQYLGDGMLVYFGYPVAHEEDAVRGVRSGLEIVATISQLEYTPPLQVRIGIHTGLVVVGEIGSSEKREMLALGETPNLAARVQGVAAPDTVVMSAVTQRLVQGLFECQDLGPQTLKGISTLMSVYRVIGESTAQSRFEVAVRTGLTLLVGRESELGLLRQRWDQAKAGDGQVVLLSGEPGIGKSRLVQELKDHVAHDSAVRIECRCSPYHQNSALYPIIDHLQRLLRFEREDAPTEKLRKLEAGIQRAMPLHSEAIPLLATLLSLPHPEGYPPMTFSPQKQKEKTHEVLVAWLIAETKQHPVYTIWEDLHWADPSTLEVLKLGIDQAPTAKLYLLLTFRPEFIPPWGNRSHLSQVTLSRLGRPHVETMVEQVTRGKAMPLEVLQQIVSKTDGVPLFVEELTKTVVESGLLRDEGDRYVGAHGDAPIPPLAIPSTLQDSLMARLDRLAPVKELAQLGATLGREFSYELLHAVSSFDEGSLQQGLLQLVEAELVYQRGVPPQATYLFKHALIQDTAYQSLLKSKRQHYHQQIAQKLEAQFPETKETQPELLAHHYTEAGLIAQAIPYWQKAGERANQRSAYVEAIAHVTKGLELLKTLPDSPEHTQQELTLQIALGPALIAAKGFAAPEVGQVYARAQELCGQIDETPQLFPVLFGVWLFRWGRGELQPTRELGERLLRLARSGQDPALLLEAHHALWPTLVYLGELTSGCAHWEQGIALHDPQHHRPLAVLYGGHDPGVCCRNFAAVALWLMGQPDQALKKSHEALILAQELAQPYSLALALEFAAKLRQLRREEQVAQEQAAAVIVLSREQGFALTLAWGTILQGWVLVQQGRGEEGIAQIRQRLSALRAIGTEITRPYHLALLAEAYGKVGQIEEGLGVIDEALDIVHKTGERWYEAELYRLKGTLTLQSEVQGPKSEVEKEAEECFHKAITISRRQSAKSWELRAVMSLSRLWQQQGKQHEARTTLAAIYGWFTEGFDTKDLQEAKALLGELAHG